MRGDLPRYADLMMFVFGAVEIPSSTPTPTPAPTKSGQSGRSESHPGVDPLRIGDRIQAKAAKRHTSGQSVSSESHPVVAALRIGDRIPAKAAKRRLLMKMI